MGNDNAFNKYQNAGLDRDAAVRNMEFRRKSDEAREKDGQRIVVNEEEFYLPLTMKIKPYMNLDEERVFIEALQNWKHGLITVENLGMIAENPGWYTPMGMLIPAMSAEVVERNGFISMTNGEWIMHVKDEKNPPFAMCGLSWDDIPKSLEHGVFTVCKTCQEVGMHRKPFEMEEALERPEPAVRISVAETNARIAIQNGTFTAEEMLPRIRQEMGWAPAYPSTDEVITNAVELDNQISAVNHPPHYNQYKDVEIIDVCEELNFNRGNAVKYIARAGFKNEATEVQDLEKALWYIERELGRDTDEESLGDLDRVMLLVSQMNYYRGTAVWSIAGAGRIDNRNTAKWDLKDSVRSITSEIKRLKELGA